jgi:hypothetical protein
VAAVKTDLRHIPRHVVVAAAGILVLTALVRAHDVAVEQIVEVTVQPRGDELAVRLHVPASALGDAQLPALGDGTLDTARLAGPLQITAAETARALDLQQDDTVLALLRSSASVGSDRRSVDIELAYRLPGGSAGLSARLNTFQSAPLRPVRTNVRYVAPAGPLQILSVTGNVMRVRFDPGRSDVASLFAARALTAVVAAGDHLLWLVCLLLPLRSAKESARLVGATLTGQVAAIAVAALYPTAATAPLAATIAASAIAIGSLQNIVSARHAYVAALGFAFGILNGVTFGEGLGGEWQFGGSHVWTAAASFLLLVVAGQAWLAAIIWATRAWLATRGLPERAATLVVSMVIAHTAVHRTMERGRALVDGGFTGKHLLLWLTLGWAATMTLIAIVAALRDRRGAGRAGAPDLA